MKKPLLLSVLIGLLVTHTAVAAPPPKYNLANQDAGIASPDELVSTLDAVSPNNRTLVWNADKTMLKVVTWKSQSAYQNFLLPYTQTSSNEDFVIWVTLAPKVHNFCHNFLTLHPDADQAALDYRLKQRLGLNPDWQYDVFVELWVSPSDLFRPCVDPEPTDTSCNLDFGGTPPVVKNIKDYPAFYKNTYYKSFRSSSQVPWTGLGYTYDWKNATKTAGALEKGASEFILSPSTPYIVDRAVPTWQYCAQ
ncbi:MAG: hypothetical protein WAW36_11225 [Methylovulum miyakonense]|uniref:hypothetical protein n=1 Tax=Methylovulum miyakonense TaxID=645578 RepID=UPI003BB70160